MQRNPPHITFASKYGRGRVELEQRIVRLFPLIRVANKINKE
jgi:hypothetical protein